MGGLHALKNLTFNLTSYAHGVFGNPITRSQFFNGEIQIVWISKYTMCVTGVNWKGKFLRACMRFNIRTRIIINTLINNHK